MAQGAGQANPWALRVGIFGLTCILLGSIVLFSQTDAIDNAFSPKNVSEIKITGDGSEVGELEPGCYVAIGLDGASHGDLTLTKMIGSSIGSESINSTSCPTDWQPMDSSGVEYEFIEEWKVTVKGEYALRMDCSSNNECGNSTIWLVDVSKAQWNLFKEGGLLASGGLCCFGFLALPISLIIYYSNKNKPNVMMVNSDGQIIPLTDLTPDKIKQLQNKQVTESVENPFADTGITTSEDFIDGREGVESGSLLTTEQVFALMKGDVDEAQKRVSDPFADFNQIQNIEQDEVKTSNTKDIAFWDMGDESKLSRNDLEQVTRKDTKNISKINKVESKEETWKEWDDL
jgi:hypothetical protein